MGEKFCVYIRYFSRKGLKEMMVWIDLGAKLKRLAPVVTSLSVLGISNSDWDDCHGLLCSEH